MHVLIALVCAAVRPWPETRRVRSPGGFTRRHLWQRPSPNRWLSVYERKSFLAGFGGSGRDGPGRARVGSGRGFRVTASARYRRRYPCSARPPGRGPNRGQGREPVIGKFQIGGYRHFFISLRRLPAIVVVIDRLSGEGGERDDASWVTIFG